MVWVVIPEWITKAEERLKESIRQITIQNKLDYHFVNDSRTIENSIHNICHALQRIPQDKDMLEAQAYFENQKKGKRKDKKK